MAKPPAVRSAAQARWFRRAFASGGGSRRRAPPLPPACRGRRPSSPGVRAGAGPAAAYPRTPPGPAPGTAGRWRPGRSPLRPPGGRRRPGGQPPASPPPALQAVVFRDSLEGVVGGREGVEAVRVLGSAAHVEVGERCAVLRQLLERALVQQVVDIDEAAHPVALDHVRYAAGAVPRGGGAGTGGRFFSVWARRPATSRCSGGRSPPPSRPRPRRRRWPGYRARSA